MAGTTVSQQGARQALRIYAEEREQLYALISALERQLGELCNQGESPRDDSPLAEWRLAQIAEGMVESLAIERAMASFLGLDQ